MNTILNERQLESYYCTLCYAVFDLKRRHVVLANSGLPYAIRLRKTDRPADSDTAPESIELAGVPLGSFPGTTYDELTLDLQAGDLFVFCSDGVFEANDVLLREFGSTRLMKVIEDNRERPAKEIVDAIFGAVQEFRGEALPNDDMTAVAVKITS
jgi:sigma-B regulation protein RsbU (phosphoserine phosphatase)